jgi:phospholipid/cholesterol/gamma-HCH transport system ATP-binding protein
MVKRVALARALALEPELLVLDEPTAGLDPDLSSAFVELIRSLHRALGLTVILVTHDLDTLAALATRVAVLSAGRYWPSVPSTKSPTCVIPSLTASFMAPAARPRWHGDWGWLMENRAHAIATGLCASF